MFRLFLAVTATLVAVPAAAATYSAKPAIPTSERIIARDVSWQCGPAACLANSAESRPAVICQGLAKRTGRIESFTVNGQSFSAAELERCNASAKPAPAAELAAQ